MDIMKLMDVPVAPNPAYRRDKDKMDEKDVLNMFGHPYVRLIKVGKRRAFWLLCERCLVACNGIICMFCHLGGRMHAENIYETKKRFPYPFNDGRLLCFNNPHPPELGKRYHIGHGIIGARYYIEEGGEFGTGKIGKIWCEWVGVNPKRISGIQEHNFSVVAYVNETKKICRICFLSILPGKDCGTLLNRATDRYACSSRNMNGVFHPHHISCLVQWILLCEVKDIPVFCSDCQGTGINANWLGDPNVCLPCHGSGILPNGEMCTQCTGIGTDGVRLEQPTVDLAQMYQYRMEVSHACRRWRRSPDVLRTPDVPLNGSLGLYFPPETSRQLYVPGLKALSFWRGVA